MISWLRGALGARVGDHIAVHMSTVLYRSPHVYGTLPHLYRYIMVTTDIAYPNTSTETARCVSPGLTDTRVADIHT
jgi:hypothetical protein